MKKLEIGLYMLSVLLLILTPKFVELANINRLKPGVGGEALLFFFPLWGALLIREYRLK